LPTVSVENVEDVVHRLLQSRGAPPANAEMQAALLIDAELRGLASHGLLRLPRILERIDNGVADPKAVGDARWDAPGFLRIDGQKGLGPVVGLSTLSLAAERARDQGVVVAAITNANHLGSLAFYAERVALQGQCLIAFTTSEALVHPWGGRQAMIGTNPIAIGMPAEDEPFVMDTATSLVSMGKIHDYANRGEPIPADWALDANGAPTTDASRAKAGAIAPFGGAKGYALGLAFELLVVGLAGGALGRDVRGTLDSTAVCNKSDLFIVIDHPVSSVSAYLAAIRDAEPAQGFANVRIPGERGRALRQQRRADGLPVDDALWAQIMAMRQEMETR